MNSTRPVDFDDHPLMQQNYILPTPSIEELYHRVRRLVTLRVPGAIIFAYPRYGKTYAIRYLTRYLRCEMPTLVIVSVGCRKSKSHSEDLFFSTLLEAAGHKAPETGTIAKKRRKLLERLTELVDRSKFKFLILFADEAQRMDSIEYEWLRDVHDELERRGIRMITLLFGQPELMHQKSAFREARQTQIVARFMIDEIPFRGVRDIDDLATCLAAYDATVFPEGSEWTYTRFFFPVAFENGFRLVEQATYIWNAFQNALEAAKADYGLDIPMQYLARTIEIAFIDYAKDDSTEFSFSAKIWESCVAQSNFVSAQEELRLIKNDNLNSLDD